MHSFRHSKLCNVRNTKEEMNAHITLLNQSGLVKYAECQRQDYLDKAQPRVPAQRGKTETNGDRRRV